MSLAEQWDAIEESLPEGWDDARLRLLADGLDAAERATRLLAPFDPFRTGREIRFFAVSHGSGPGADAVRRALAHLDEARIEGTLELVSSGKAVPAPAVERGTLAEEWDATIATLPPDWTDLHLELELGSAEWLMRASVNMVPLNPRRAGGKPALRFRCARRFGYGAAPEMVRRCLERCDRDGIRGELRVLRVICDSYPVGTQGPVWHVAGRTV